MNCNKLANITTESPEIDRLTILSYRSSFDEKYHIQINTMDEYKCIPNPYSSWIIDKCCDSMINYIKIHLNKYMKLYADYEIEYVYYYLEYLFRQKTQTYINVSLKRYQKVNLERLNELINPNFGLLLNTNKFKNIKSFQQDYITAARKVAIINKIFTSKLLKIVLKNDIQQKINIKHQLQMIL